MKAIIATAAAIAALTAVAGVAAPASAETTASLGWTRTDAKDADVNLDGITGRATWTAGYFGVEGEVSAGTGSDTTNVGGTNVKVKEEYQAAIYGVAKAPVGTNFDVFARVGYGTTKVKASAAGTGLSGSEQSWNYGVGAEYFFDGHNGIRGDYTRENFRHDAGDADVWSVSYVHKF
ncbi:MAG TPA: porin family protein [Caulobacteraceae bacterium]|nr:porin family protein [Caulobacteraceae bacterium]